MYDVIRYEVDDPVALVTLDRPEAMNAWTNEMDAQLRDAIGRAAADPAVVGIVITGAGRAFCAGADMKALDRLSSGASGDNVADSGAGVSPDGGESGDFEGRFPWIMSVPKPVIAAINGPVAGMAFPFALCCDLRIVSPQALFVTAFAQRGLIAEWGLAWLLPRLVGPAVALDLLYSSRRVSGAEAVELGLANRMVEADELLDTCRAYVEDLARSCSPASLAVMKQQVYSGLHQGLGRAENEAERLMIESFERPDFREGVSSFLEKRPPAFPRIGAS